MCNKCTCGKNKLMGPQDLQRLLKIRDSLSMLADLEYELEIVQSRLDKVNTIIESLTN